MPLLAILNVEATVQKIGLYKACMGPVLSSFPLPVEGATERVRVSDSRNLQTPSLGANLGTSPWPNVESMISISEDWKRRREWNPGCGEAVALGRRRWPFAWRTPRDKCP